jgi:hypothetical protein
MSPPRPTPADLAHPGRLRKLTPRYPWRSLKRAAVVLGTSLAAAALSLPGAAAAQKPAPGVHGEVHFAIWSVDSDGPDSQAILSGAIADYGPAVTVLPNGHVDPEHTSEMELRLHQGTIRLYIDGITSKFRAQAAHEPIYPATCSDFMNVTASVPIVAGSGTGAYRGLHGEFSSTLSGYEDEKAHPCGGGFVAQILIMTGSGTVSS